MDIRGGQKRSSLAMRVFFSSFSHPSGILPLVCDCSRRDSAHRQREKTAAFCFQRTVLRLPELAQQAQPEHILVMNTTVKKGFQELPKSASVENLTSVR